MLNEQELERYKRSIAVIGEKGQERLKQAKVLVVGAGGLGSPASMYLAAAGVGTLGIADGDVVDSSNLQRQVVHQAEDVGKEKSQSAQEQLKKLNSFITINQHGKLTEENAESIIKDYDVVVDGVDSLEVKQLINKTCVALKKPLVYGAAVGMEGQLAVFQGNGCLTCLVETPAAPSCSVEGVLPTVPGVIGMLQAGEVIKLILGMKPVEGLLLYDFHSGDFRSFAFTKNPHCSTCGDGTPQPKPQGDEITCQELNETKGQVQLVDVREQWEWDIAHIEGAKLIPLGMLSGKLEELDKNKPVVTYCHSGNRSLEAARFLQDEGFQARSLKGGINKWTEEVDPSLQRY